MVDMDVMRKGIAATGLVMYLASQITRRALNLSRDRPNVDLTMSIFESYAGSLALALGVREIIPEQCHPNVVGGTASVIAGTWVNGVREMNYCKRINAGKIVYNTLGAMSLSFI